VWICHTNWREDSLKSLDDWLTVHRTITLVNFQLDAQNSYLFIYNTFIKILCMFRAFPCLFSGGLHRNCIYIYIYIFSLWRCAPMRVMVSSFLMFLDHTQRRTTVGRTPLDEWSARRTDLYQTTHNTHNRQTSMLPVGFKPTISAGERPQTYTLDRAATGTGVLDYIFWNLYTYITVLYVFCLCCRMLNKLVLVVPSRLQNVIWLSTWCSWIRAS
jgi:hypothetical protein